MRLPRHLPLEILERVAADVVAVNAALLLALTIRLVALLWARGTGADIPSRFFADILRGSAAAYLKSAPLLTALCLGSFVMGGFYTYGRAYRGRRKALVIFQAVTGAHLAFAAIAYAFLGTVGWLPRTAWLASWVLTLGLIGGLRLAARVWRATVWAEARIWGGPEGKAVRNVLVIGGAGYIGSVLVRKLIDRGYFVTVLDALLYGDEGIRDLYGCPGLELIRDDLRNVEAVVRALRYADAVVHLGALVGDPACAVDEKLTLEINLAATRLIAEAARGFGVQRFIFASTCSVYGASDALLDERSALNPVSLYARTKIASERVLLALTGERFAPTVLRFATIHGLSPRPRFDLVVNTLTAQAVCEKAISISGGNQWRPFIHVSDAAEAIRTCLEAPIPVIKGQTFNAGTDDENYQIAQLGELTRELVPGIAVSLKEDEADCRNYRVSFAKIRRELGFVPRRTVGDGIREIKEAIESGHIADYRNARYSNYRTLLEGNGDLMRLTRMTSLYAQVLEDAQLLLREPGMAPAS